MRPPLTLSADEAHHFLARVLGLELRHALATLGRDRRAFVEALMRRFRRRVPFQSVNVLATNQLPSTSQLRQEVLSGQGGLCLTLNVFLKALLEALGLEAFLSLCTIHHTTRHPTVLVRDLVRAGDLHCVEIGCGHVLPTPLLIPTSARLNPQRHQRGYLELELVRRQTARGTTVVRYHTYRRHQRPDQRDRFWEMDLQPSSWAQVLDAVRPVYRGYAKLRVVLVRGPELLITAYKDQLRLTEDPLTRQLRQHRFASRDQCARSLARDLPQLSERQIAAALQRVRW